jgi:hypothetical protein
MTDCSSTPALTSKNTLIFPFTHRKNGSNLRYALPGKARMKPTTGVQKVDVFRMHLAQQPMSVRRAIHTRAVHEV